MLNDVALIGQSEILLMLNTGISAIWQFDSFRTFFEGGESCKGLCI